METDLTKRLKALTHGFKPKLPTKMRTIRWADEVWTPTGIVDSIRFEDYYASDTYVCPFINPEKFSEERRSWFAQFRTNRHCDNDSILNAGDPRCHGCVFRHHVYNVGMMITCYEVKITLSDFKSSNGHNFHGNENYYVVPKELAPKIESLVPEDIGILVYVETEKMSGLRMYKKSGWHEVEEATQIQLLYNAMKKWCDHAVFV